jgi:hypothetical protein
LSTYAFTTVIAQQYGLVTAFCIACGWIYLLFCQMVDVDRRRFGPNSAEWEPTNFTASIALQINYFPDLPISMSLMLVCPAVSPAGMQYTCTAHALPDDYSKLNGPKHMIWKLRRPCLLVCRPRTPLKLVAPPMARHLTIVNFTAASSLISAHNHHYASVHARHDGPVAAFDKSTIYSGSWLTLYLPRSSPTMRPSAIA